MGWTGKHKSTWDRVRITIAAADYLASSSVVTTDLEALGLFWKLVPYTAYSSISTNPSRIARIARCHTRVVKRLWPQIEKFFDPCPSPGFEDHVRLKPQEWYGVALIGDERQDLRHLLNALVAFWGNACVYCGAAGCDLEIEHIVPLSRGGDNNRRNLTLACPTCNARKGRKTAEEFGHPHIHEMASRIQ